MVKDRSRNLQVVGQIDSKINQMYPGNTGDIFYWKMATNTSTRETGNFNTSSAVYCV